LKQCKEQDEMALSSSSSWSQSSKEDSSSLMLPFLSIGHDMSFNILWPLFEAKVWENTKPFWKTLPCHYMNNTKCKTPKGFMKK